MSQQSTVQHSPTESRITLWRGESRKSTGNTSTQRRNAVSEQVARKPHQDDAQPMSHGPGSLHSRGWSLCSTATNNYVTSCSKRIYTNGDDRRAGSMDRGVRVMEGISE